MRTITRCDPFSRAAVPASATLLGIALLAGCASTSSTSTSTSTSTPQASNGRTRLEVLSATFISARTGWALALQPCHQTGCPRLKMRKTTDGGRHWSPAPAPPARVAGYGSLPAARAVSQILFADARDGWVFGPGLWATHDGGRSWNRVGTRGLAVQDLAAQDGRVIATFGRCPPTAFGCSWFQVYSAPVTADRWRPVPATAGSGLVGSVTLAAGTGYVAVVHPPGNPGRPSMILLAGPADGSRAWRRLAPPCPPAFNYDAVVAATPHLALVADCASEPGAGSQVKRAYFSPDGGRTWRRLADPPEGGYLSEASITPMGTTILLTGGRSDIYLSWDTGRTWHTSASLNEAAGLAGAGFSFDAAMTTSTQGFAIQDGAIYRQQMWFTYNAGHTWRPVTLH